MSYKLLREIMDYEAEKSNYSKKEQQLIENKFLTAYRNLKEKASDYIVSYIDQINNS